MAKPIDEALTAADLENFVATQDDFGLDLLRRAETKQADLIDGEVFPALSRLKRKSLFFALSASLLRAEKGKKAQHCASA